MHDGFFLLLRRFLLQKVCRKYILPTEFIENIAKLAFRLIAVLLLQQIHKVLIWTGS